MNRYIFAVLILCGVALGVTRATAQLPAKQSVDTIEGTLRVHPKFHYRYYVDGFGAGQNCALFKADERLKEITPGTRIRVQGNLASRYFGDSDDKTPALVRTWIIFMDVDDVEIVETKK